MKTLIKPYITVSEPVKNKAVGYSIALDREYPHRFVIRARSTTGKSRGIVGYILKDGSIQVEDKKHNIHQLLTDQLLNKVNFTLDLIYGESRMESCDVHSSGLIEVKTK